MARISSEPVPVPAADFKKLRTAKTTSPEISACMRSNKAKNTEPELALRKLLWRSGIRGYRKHARVLGAIPDLFFPKTKLCVFLHGCFWHGCPLCRSRAVPRTNTDYWLAKFKRNLERDEQVGRTLSEAGFESVIVWECQLKRVPDAIVEAVRSALEAGKSVSPAVR